MFVFAKKIIKKTIAVKKNNCNLFFPPFTENMESWESADLNLAVIEKVFE